MSLSERKLSAKELRRREEIAKDLPDAEFKQRYGDDWMSVKMATATNIAKNEEKEVQEKKQLLFGMDESSADFNFAAAQAAVAGETEFEFEGKTYPVQMDLEKAKEIVASASDDVQEAMIDPEAPDESVISNTLDLGTNAYNMLSSLTVRRLMTKLADVIVNPINKQALVAGAKQVGLSAIPVSVLLAVGLGGRFAWRQYLKNKANRQLARKVAANASLRSEAEELAKDQDVTADLIAKMEKSEVKAGV